MATRKVFFFDLFNTILDMQNAYENDLKAYADHLRHYQETHIWTPLHLPRDWEELRPFPEVEKALAILHNEGHLCVTLSNCPIALQTRLIANMELDFDMAVPLECYKVFKPTPRAYVVAMELLEVKACDSYMVSGNAHFGDMEASKKLGMEPWLVYRDHVPTSVMECNQTVNLLTMASYFST